jgi:hypothetical protein
MGADTRGVRQTQTAARNMSLRKVAILSVSFDAVVFPEVSGMLVMNVRFWLCGVKVNVKVALW